MIDGKTPLGIKELKKRFVLSGTCTVVIMDTRRQMDDFLETLIGELLSDDLMVEAY